MIAYIEDVNDLLDYIKAYPGAKIVIADPNRAGFGRLYVNFEETEYQQNVRKENIVVLEVT